MAGTGAPSASAEALVGSAFVGRERELAALIGGLDDAAAGRGRVFLIGGEPGIGKSRLADELASAARQRGHPTVLGRVWEDAGAPPYWPWIQALRALIRGKELEALRRDLGYGAADLAQILPELAAMVPTSAPALGGDPETARFRLFDSATAFLIGLARDSPVVVVLDDLHAADTASLLLLRFVAGQVGSSRLLIVGTYRSLGPADNPALAGAFEELGREPSVRTLDLHDLDEAQVARLLEALAGGSLGPAAVKAISRETTGNPLFVTEGVRFLRATGGLDKAADLGSVRLAVPARIREVIGRRVGLLGADASQALKCAAAIGPEFDAELVSRVLPASGVDTGLALSGAAAAGFLLPVAGRPGRWRFSHGLVRESLQDMLLPVERSGLHQRIGETLERDYAPTTDQLLPELAYHFAEATPATRAKALDYARRAGRQAAAALAYEDAARFYGMALSALGGDGAPGEDLAELTLLLAHAQSRAGDLDAARSNFLRAAELARRNSDGVRLGQAALGYGGRFIWSREGHDRQLVPLLQEAIELVGERDAQLKARLQARLACAWRSAPDHFGECDSLTQHALTVARRLGDPATLSYALVGRFWATMWPDNPVDRLAVAAELVDVAERSADSQRIIDGHQALCVAYLELGLLAEVQAELEILGRLVVELREPSQLWAMRTYETVVALAVGDFDRASEQVELEPSSPSINAIGDDVVTTRMHRYLLRRAQGRTAEEEAPIRDSLKTFPWYPYHRAALACLLLDVDRPAEARTVFAELARDEFSVLYRDCEWLLGMGLASEACARLGDAAAAAVLYSQLLPFAGRHAVAHAEGSVGAVDQYLGRLAATLGQLDVAVRHLDDAIRVLQQMGALPWLAWARGDLARVLADRAGAGDAERAQAELLAARDLAQRLGMVGLMHAIETPQRTADTTPPPAVPAVAVEPAVGRHGVFRRAGEYWTVGLDGSTATVRDAKGMRYLALLLARPGTEMHSLDMVVAEASGALAAGPAQAAIGELSGSGLGDAGELLDAEARQEYRERLRELDSDIAQAEEWNDPGRVERLRDERDFLIRELSAAVGLGGRPRVAASAAERARLNVGKAIRAATARIEANNPPVGRHLSISIHTGTFCSYVPDPVIAISWEL